MDPPLNKKRSRGGGLKINKRLRAAAFRKAGCVKPAAKQLLDLVKERWPQTKELLVPAPPVEYDDSGAHILLTTAHFKHLESVKFAIEALVDECKNIIAHASSDSAQPLPHDDGAAIEQEGESYSAQPFQDDDGTEGTATEPEGGASAIEQEGESYSAQPSQHDDGTHGTATEPEGGASAIEQEGESYSAQPVQHDDGTEGTATEPGGGASAIEQEGESYSAQPSQHDDGTDGTATEPEGGASAIEQEGKSYSAMPFQYDDEATSQQEGKSYSARPARPSRQQRVFATASSSSIAPASRMEANIESEKPRSSISVDERDLLKPLSAEDLDRVYGLGFRLLGSLGYKQGSGIGADSSRAGMTRPLSSGTPQEALTRTRARPGITEAKTRKCSMDVDPPECQTCEKCIWPARMSHKSRKWYCYECYPSVPPCVLCRRETWDGYTLPPKDGGRWMCSECWSSSGQDFQKSWEPWFEERRNKFPEIAAALARSSSDDAGEGSKIRNFVWDLSSLPVSPAPVEIKEYSLSQKNLRRLQYYGHIPDEPADAVDRTFLKRFLASRPISDTEMADSTFRDPTESSIVDGVACYRFERALLPREALLRTKRIQEGWRTAFHWTPWHCIYSIVCNGCKNGRAESTKKGKIGVYSHETLERGIAYRKYTFMPDGVAWSVCCELLLDANKSARPGNQQTCTPEDCVSLEALWTSGITFADMEKLAAKAPGSLTLLGQWDPVNEINPDSFTATTSRIARRAGFTA